MSNTKDELAWHGSKLCMQICVNNENRKKFLDEKLGLGCIKWFSPQASANFKEYKLSDFAKAFPALGLSSEVLSRIEVLKSQWDAIGISADGSLILVEAKAHTDEMEQACQAKGKSKEEIKSLISNVVGEDAVWVDKYYQLANRLTYLSYLLQSGIKVKLIYLCFVDDISYKPESAETWKSYMKSVEAMLDLPQIIIDNWMHLYIDIWNSKVY